MATDEKQPEVPIFPLMEIFGGAYGVLIIILVITILMQNYVAELMEDPTRIGGIAETTISDQAGSVISLYPDRLTIEQSGETVTLEELRKPDNDFRRFAKTWFTEETDVMPLFFVYPGSNNVFLEAEHTLADLDIWYFNQLVINKEMVERLKELNKTALAEL